MPGAGRGRDEPQAPAVGWRPLTPARNGGQAGRRPSVAGFARLARVHAANAGGEALVAIGLAGSLFFSISPDEARPKVALYLLLTMAPFAVVAPLIGPMLDRYDGGRKRMILIACIARAGLCVLMADDLDSLLLFPEAFAVLVLSKGYGVAKASLVPSLVDDPSTLVQANGRLTMISGVVGFLAAGPGILLFQIGPAGPLLLAAAVFAVGAVLATRIPTARKVAPGTPAERNEVRGAGLLLAATAMAMLRGIVGFLAFLLAFSLRGDDAPTWWFGVVLAASGVGALAGAAVAPALRRLVAEERIFLGCLVGVSVTALVAIQIGGRVSGAVLGFTVGLAASAGRLCFDAIVQRDAPDADKARLFARFETRFQLAWVLGALVPVALTVPRDLGYGTIAILATIAAGSYVTGRQIKLRLPTRSPRVP